MKACTFCKTPADEENVTTYHEVTSWVSGPKLDGPKLREQTGRVAHRACIEALVAGQAADQPLIPGMGGNRSDDCECGFSPHRDWCPANRSDV